MRERKILILSEPVEYDIVRSSRRTVALYVRPGGTLLIRAPWYVPLYTLLNFVHDKSGWILRQRERLKLSTPHVEETVVTDGASLWFLGEKIPIRISEGRRNSISSKDNELALTLRDGESQAHIMALVDGWYLREARKYFERRIHELADVHGPRLPLPGIVNIRKMKSRWGSCRSDGNVWFNRELIKRDPAVIDYVIIHELCHLVHHNHGKEFYSLLESFIPDYKERRNKLRNK